MTDDGFEEGDGCIASTGKLPETSTAGHLSHATTTIMAHNGLSPSASISCPLMSPTGQYETVSPSQQTTVNRSQCNTEEDSVKSVSISNDIERLVTILTPPVTPLASQEGEQFTRYVNSAHVQSDNTPNAHPDPTHARRFPEVHKQNTPKILLCDDDRSTVEIATDNRKDDGIVVGVLVAEKVNCLNTTSRSPSQASMVSSSSSSSSLAAAEAAATDLSSPISPSSSLANSSPPLSESATVAMLTFAHNRRKGSYRKRKKRRDRHRK